MSPTSDGIARLARHVLSLESARSEPLLTELDRAAQACEALGASLTRLAGSAGFSMLLARAVALAIKKDPSLTPLRVETDGSLTGVEEVRRGLNGSHPAHRGGEIVLAELLGLLVCFIGESLTLTLVRQAWPGASTDLVAEPIADPIATEEVATGSTRETP
jgi:hypothetical protein